MDRMTTTTAARISLPKIHVCLFRDGDHLLVLSPAHPDLEVEARARAATPIECSAWVYDPAQRPEVIELYRELFYGPRAACETREPYVTVRTRQRPGPVDAAIRRLPVSEVARMVAAGVEFEVVGGAEAGADWAEQELYAILRRLDDVDVVVRHLRSVAVSSPSREAQR